MIQGAELRTEPVRVDVVVAVVTAIVAVVVVRWTDSTTGASCTKPPRGNELW